MARSARDIIKELGGLTAVSTALGHRFPTTVQGWWERNAIPLKHIAPLIAVGRAKGVELAIGDFIPDGLTPDPSGVLGGGARKGGDTAIGAAAGRATVQPE